MCDNSIRFMTVYRLADYNGVIDSIDKFEIITKQLNFTYCTVRNNYYRTLFTFPFQQHRHHYSKRKSNKQVVEQS